MDVKSIYKQLTNVDIEEQKKLWNDRGKGYYGEFLVFCELYKKIPGYSKIIMNLNIPTENGKTTEIDLVLIHETGIYVFEIKHYKGTIYGDDTGNIWTQYFRTTKNNTFKNPILQNAYHIDYLKKIFNDVPLKSVVVFTNNNCDIRINNYSHSVSICTMYNLIEKLKDNFQNSEMKYSIEEIDFIFSKLCNYSQMQETILYDGKEESFISWLQPTIGELNEQKSTLAKQIDRNKIIIIIDLIISIAIVITFIIAFIYSVNTIKSHYDNELKVMEENYKSELKIAKQKYNIELEKFKQNFKHIDEIDNKDLAILHEHFSVSNISLKANSNNSVTFTAKISREYDIYGMALTSNSKYIVMTSNGMVYEYNVFGSHLKYNRNSNILGKGIRDFGNLATIKFNGVTKEEITYIKITNIELFKLDISRTLISKDLELELYSK